MLENLPSNIRMIEVGPRDGLQNESKVLKTSDKIEYIRLLKESGVKDIEVTSFVRPDRILQMSDSKKLYSELKRKKILEGMTAFCLVPNMKGLDLAMDCGVKEIAVFTSISDSFNQKNINSSIDESLERIIPVIEKAKNNNMKIRGYLSTIFGCPYEGKVDLDIMIKLSKILFEEGCFEISLGDTIGTADPIQVKTVIDKLKSSFDLNKISMHFHDTKGMALANILTSLELGITSFDSSSAGLGGCPYAGGATGNIATEDVLHLMQSLEIKTGINMDRLIKASRFILDKLEKKTSASKYYNSFSSKGL